MVDVAIVGMGKMGILHAAILGALPDARVVAVCERKAVVRRLAKKAIPGVKVVEDLSDLSSLEIDAVYVATLPGAHHPVVSAIYSSRISSNIFVEKSLASSYEEAKEMCRLTDAYGGVNRVGFQKRFGVTFKRTKELLTEGALGEITSFAGYAYSSDFAEAKADRGQSVLRGGALRDQGSHVIDLAHWYFGDLNVVEPDDVTPRGNVPADFTWAKVRASSGAEGTFGVSAEMADYRLPEIGMTITGSEGVIHVNDDRLKIVSGGRDRMWFRQDLDDSRVPFLLGDPEYCRENETFVAAIVSGQSRGGADFHAGARVERVIDAILGSQPSAQQE